MRERQGAEKDKVWALQKKLSKPPKGLMFRYLEKAKKDGRYSLCCPRRLGPAWWLASCAHLTSCFLCSYHPYHPLPSEATHSAQAVMRLSLLSAFWGGQSTLQACCLCVIQGKE
jgi:hypothetical protein